MRPFRLLPVLLIAGCSTTSGPINAPPAPTSRNPVNVTLHRVKSLEGAVAPMVFTIDGTEIYGLRDGETHRFKLDPGQYVFGWRLGFNTCAQDVWLRPGRDVDLTLSNDCSIPPEP
jgi:hypothetical protein